MLPLCLATCTRHRLAPELSFYHWKQKYSLSASQSEGLANLNIQTLYVRFFDLDWDEAYQQVIPKATLLADSSAHPYPIVPCIFITNRSFQKLNEPVEALALKTLRRIRQIGQEIPHFDLKEIQIDCDWTESTRTVFFEFLVALRDLAGPEVTLSCTIRLHQVKFPETTGIPPVQKGMLMCYNTGNIENWGTQNSILEPEMVWPYLGRLSEYPLALDLALPVFSWSLLFRDQKLIKILPFGQPSWFENAQLFQPIGPGRWSIRKSTYLDGHYLYAGDQIKLEKTDPAEILHLSKKLIGEFGMVPDKIVFFDLNTNTFDTFKPDFFKQFSDGF